MKNKAFAKINLSLNVTGVNDIGYHTIESIFLPINFFDEIEITKNEEMVYECNRKYIFFNSANTIVKAIELMKQEFSIQDNFKVVLNKHIPMQAGIAGGSSNGACVIRIINKMYHLDLSGEKIKELCLKIGADVLFTYYSKPAFVSGIGDNLEFINVKKNYHVLIVKPKSGVSTSECYEKMKVETCDHPNINELRYNLENGLEISGLLGNSLEQAAMEIDKDIKEVKDLLLSKGAKNVLMSGSGSSVFAIDEDYDKLKNIYDSLKDSDYFIRLCEVRK